MLPTVVKQLERNTVDGREKGADSVSPHVWDSGNRNSNACAAGPADDGVGDTETTLSGWDRSCVRITHADLGSSTRLVFARERIANARCGPNSLHDSNSTVTSRHSDLAVVGQPARRRSAPVRWNSINR
jgi:hypothetical protein